MGLLAPIKRIFGLALTGQEQADAEAGESNEVDELYTGMRVEVTTFDGRMLFIAKLMCIRQDTAELHEYIESTNPQPQQVEEALHVRIRGYSDYEKKAVYLEGYISPLPQHIWKVEKLSVARIGNDRAFFRLDTDVDATATSFTGFNVGERPCKMVNISIGGACIQSEHEYKEGDKFLLKVQLLEERDISTLFCEVLRIIPKEKGQFQYGCKFLGLNEMDQGKITQNIFEAQRKKRG